MPKPYLALSLLVLLLAGCTELAGLAPKSAQAPKPAPARVTKPVPQVKPQLPAAAAAARFEPQQFVGREAVDLVAQLGLPETVSEEPPATIWRYTVMGCRLDLFLYPNVETRALRALSYKVDGPTPACQAKPEGAPHGK